MAWHFESKDDYIRALSNRADQAYTMGQRWDQAIAERQPGGNVHFSYMHPVTLTVAKHERTRHYARAAALRLAIDMAHGLPPHGNSYCGTASGYRHSTTRTSDRNAIRPIRKGK